MLRVIELRQLLESERVLWKDGAHEVYIIDKHFLKWSSFFVMTSFSFRRITNKNSVIKFCIDPKKKLLQLFPSEWAGRLQHNSESKLLHQSLIRRLFCLWTWSIPIIGNLISSSEKNLLIIVLPYYLGYKAMTYKVTIFDVFALKK